MKAHIVTAVLGILLLSLFAIMESRGMMEAAMEREAAAGASRQPALRGGIIVDGIPPVDVKIYRQPSDAAGESPGEVAEVPSVFTDPDPGVYERPSEGGGTAPDERP